MRKHAILLEFSSRFIIVHAFTRAIEAPVTLKMFFSLSSTTNNIPHEYLYQLIAALKIGAATVAFPNIAFISILRTADCTPQIMEFFDDLMDGDYAS